MKIFFNRWLVLAACFFLVESAIAQIRGTEITVVVAPDHADWNYETGEKARFKRVFLLLFEALSSLSFRSGMSSIMVL